MGGKKLHFLLAVLISILCVIILTFPTIRHLTTHLIGDGGDNLQFFGWTQIAINNLSQNKWPFVDTQAWRYPNGFEFSRSIDGFLFFLFFLATHYFFDSSIITFNVAVLLLLTLNVIISYLFFSSITKEKTLGLIGAIIYGLSPYVLARAVGHINLIFIAGFPLFGYSLLSFYKSNSHKKNIFWLGFSILLIGYGSMQYLLIFLGFLPWFILLSLLDARERTTYIFFVLVKEIKFFLFSCGLF